MIGKHREIWIWQHFIVPALGSPYLALFSLYGIAGILMLHERPPGTPEACSCEFLPMCAMNTMLLTPYDKGSGDHGGSRCKRKQSILGSFKNV